MLVGWVVQFFVDYVVVGVRLIWFDGRGLDDVGQFGFQLNCVVLVEVLVKVVIVIV